MGDRLLKWNTNPKILGLNASTLRFRMKKLEIRRNETGWFPSGNGPFSSTEGGSIRKVGCAM